MRTCPACGENTDAGMTEPCTECGFSPTGDPAAELEGFEGGGGFASEEGVDQEVTISREGGFEPVPTGTAPPPTPPPTAPVPTPAPSSTTKTFPWRLVITGIVFAAIFLINRVDIFSSDPGPDPGDVEQAIVDEAEKDGIPGITVDCPDDSADTEVGGTFVCVVTGPNGETVNTTVHNQEDQFSWRLGR